LEASYKGVDIDMANAMNESFKRGLDFCPSINERMQMVGSGQERNKQFKQALTDYYLNNSTSIQNARALGYSEKQIQSLAKKWASRSVGKVGSNVLAFASDTTTTGIEEIKKFSGIFVNNKYADFALMAKEAEENVAIKFHPVGTGSVKAIFDHEMGHQLDYALGLRNNPDIVKLYRSMNRAEIKEKLSDYANENIKEFIAEAYSEYLNNPEPRAVAKQVGEIIERLANEQR
jgi:cytochrome c553